MLAASAASYGGMLKVFPWGLGLGGGDVKSGHTSPGQARPLESHTAQAPALNKMKRKRQGSRGSSRCESPSQSAQPPRKKQELAPRPTEQANPSVSMQTQLHCTPPSTPSTPTQVLGAVQPQPPPQQVELPQPDLPRVFHQNHTSSMDKSQQTTRMIKPPTDGQLKDTVEMQFGLEILLKHRELRLIDQEIAKCQVALEQIRRCSIIPYPALMSDPRSMLDVATGSGPSHGTNASHAAPWGVTNGPYTRHYQKFLITDQAFGDHIEDLSLDSPNLRHYPDREGRTSRALPGAGSSKSRVQRGSMRGAGALQALPHGYSEVKQEKGPMIVKRASDNKMVKLVCLHCRREDFNSAQGFINHCRIAHQQSFASHEAAAAACGEVMDGVEIADSKGEAAAAVSVGAGQVHPLIRTAQLPSANATPRRKKQSSGFTPKTARPTLNTDSGPSTPRVQFPPTLTSTSENPFRPSPLTPHLSALVSKSGIGGDLAGLVIEAKTKAVVEDDPDAEENTEAEEIPETPQEHTGRPQTAGSRLPARSELANGSIQNSTSKAPKVLTRPLQQYSSPHFINPGLSSTLRTSTPYSFPSVRHHSTKPNSPTSMELDNSPPSLNLSPHTVESHPAPSLVSDDGEYDNAHSEDEVPSSAHISDEEDLHVRVEDHEHRHSIGDEAGGSSSGGEVPVPKQHHGTVSSRGIATPGRRRGGTGGRGN